MEKIRSFASRTSLPAAAVNIFVVPDKKLIIFCAALTILGTAPVGFHYSSLNSRTDYMADFIFDTFQTHYHWNSSGIGKSYFLAFACSLLPLGGVVGSLISKGCMERIGRKWSVVGVMNLLYILGSLLMACSESATSFEMFLIGRFVFGIGTGFALAVIPVYFTECSPLKFRGSMGSLNYFGLLLGTSFALYLNTVISDSHWPYVMGVPLVPAIMFLASFKLFPESPKYLHFKKHQFEEARQAIEFFYGPDRVDDVLHVFRMEESGSRDSGSTVNFRSLWRRNVHIQGFLLAVISNIAVNSSGVIVILAYSYRILKTVHMDDASAQKATYVLVAANVFFGFLQICIISWCKRRNVMLTSLFLIMILYVAFIALAPINNLVVKAFVAAFLIAVAALSNLGVGPISLFLSGEISYQPFRSTASSSAMFTRTILSVLFMFLFPPMLDRYKQNIFFFFIALTFLCFAYLYLKMPETKDTPLNRIVAPWRMSVEPLNSRSQSFEPAGETSNQNVTNRIDSISTVTIGVQ